MGDVVSNSGAVEDLTVNKATPKPPANNTSVNVSVGEVKKRIYTFRELEIIEVNKETIDRIKLHTDSAIKDVRKGSLRKDIYLGIFTTLLGLVIGGCSDVIKMFTSKALTSDGILPFVYLIVAVIMLWLYCRERETENALTDSAIDTLKKIRENVDSIYKNSAIPANELPDTDLPNQMDNHFARSDKESTG